MVSRPVMIGAKREYASCPSRDTASYVTAMAGVTVDLNARKGTGGDADG